MPRGNKPGERRGGRQKGTPNRLTSDVKAMVLQALDMKGGVQYLMKQADENPTAFLTLLGKILPTQITGDPENPVVVKTITDENDLELMKRVIANNAQILQEPTIQ